MLIRRVPIGTVAYLGGLMAVPEEFTWSWGQLIQYNTEYFCKTGEYIHQDRATSSFHTTARNGLARTFLGDWLFTTDCDHRLEPDVVVRMVSLMKEKDLDVLTAIYRYKAPPFLPTIYAWVNGAYMVVSQMDWNAPLVKIDCAGAGCLLVRRRVFERIWNELHEEPFDVIGKFSEDFSFFQRCMKLGIACYVAPKIYSTHLRVTGVTNDMFDPSEVVAVPMPTGGTVAVTPA
jgi:hypothetical protein